MKYLTTLLLACLTTAALAASPEPVPDEESVAGIPYWMWQRKVVGGCNPVSDTFAKYGGCVLYDHEGRIQELETRLNELESDPLEALSGNTPVYDADGVQFGSLEAYDTHTGVAIVAILTGRRLEVDTRDGAVLWPKEFGWHFSGSQCTGAEIWSDLVSVARADQVHILQPNSASSYSWTILFLKNDGRKVVSWNDISSVWSLGVQNCQDKHLLNANAQSGDVDLTLWTRTPTQPLIFRYPLTIGTIELPRPESHDLANDGGLP